jgi:hypothetical protein
MQMPTRPRMARFKAGKLGGYVGVKFRLRDPALIRMRLLLIEETARSSASFHKKRMLKL